MGTLYTVDSNYHQSFDHALKMTGEPTDQRRERFYNVIQCLQSLESKDGLIAEAGCLYGLSTYLICADIRRRRPGFSGHGIQVFDSFKGIGNISVDDDGDLSHHEIRKLLDSGSVFSDGAFLWRFRKTMAEFPDVEVFSGWIPEVFRLTDRNSRYKFVHIDLDLYKPTYDALNFFFPRLTDGGIIVCDDYGFVEWPGCKKAVDQFARENECRVVALTCGNALIFR